MDVDASVVYGDLAPAGLPAEAEDDTDEDLSPSGRPACSNNYAVSPRELTRLLRKLQVCVALWCSFICFPLVVDSSSYLP